MMMRKTLLAFICAFISCGAFSQSSIVKSTKEAYPESKDYYLYESTLRALNQQNATELNDIIKNIDKLSILNVTATEENQSLPKFNAISQEVIQGGFIEMMSMGGPEMNFAWFSNKEENPDILIAIVDKKDQFFIFEMKGEIDIAKIYALKGSDLGEFSSSLMNQDFFK